MVHASTAAALTALKASYASSMSTALPEASSSRGTQPTGSWPSPLHQPPPVLLKEPLVGDSHWADRGILGSIEHQLRQLEGLGGGGLLPPCGSEELPLSSSASSEAPSSSLPLSSAHMPL